MQLWNPSFWKRMTIKVWQSGQKMWQFMECVTRLEENAWRAWFVPAHSRIYHGTHLPRDTSPGATFFFWHILHVAQLAPHTQWHCVHLSVNAFRYRSDWRSSSHEMDGFLTKQLHGRNLALYKAIRWGGAMWFDLRFVIQWLPSGNHAFRTDPVCTQR